MKTIVWDVDDVLNNFTKDWFENYWLINHPETNITFSQLSQNPPHLLLNVEFKEYIDSIDNFRKSNGINLNPVPEIYNWFERFGNNFIHIALTSAPLFYSHISSYWVFNHFKNWIRTFHIVPSARPEDNSYSYDLNKADFLKNLNKIDFFIDDSPVNIADVNKIGIKTLTMPRPWNDSKLNIDDFLSQIKTD